MACPVSTGEWCVDTVTMLAVPGHSMGRRRETANMTPSFIENIYIRSRRKSTERRG